MRERQQKQRYQPLKAGPPFRHGQDFAGGIPGHYMGIAEGIRWCSLTLLTYKVNHFLNIKVNLQ
jgi:hypothetical protein